jgi:hypothetical protein
MRFSLIGYVWSFHDGVKRSATLGHNIPRQTIKSEWEMEGREKEIMARKGKRLPKVGG